MLNEFYGDILPEQGYFCLFLIPDNRHIWAESHEELVELTQQYADRTGVYFGTAAFESVANRRQSNVLSLRALRLDIDAGPEKVAKHGLDAVYATQKDALADSVAFFKATGLIPSYIVSSGAGLHLYFCLGTDLPPAAWLPLAQALSATCKQHGLKIDPSVTEDSARILRPLGALHGNGKRVSVIKRTGLVYSAAQLAALMPVEPALPTAPRRARSGINDDIVTAFQGAPSSALKVAEHCAALREIAVSRGDVPEPQWRAMLGLVKRTVEGLDIAQEWSSGHDGYDDREVERKFEAWNAGPTTCAEFAKHTDACAACPHRGKVKSPINLGLMTTPEIEQLPEEVQAAVMPAPVAKAAPGKPWDGCMPAGFDVVDTKAGIPVLVYSLKVEKESDTGEIVPVVIHVPFTHDIFWFGQWAEADGTDDTAQVTLHLWTGHSVKTYLLDQTLVASPFKLLEFLSGKAIHTTTHKRASQAMQDYAKAHLQRIKSISKRPKVTDHLGLRILDDGELVCTHGQHVIYADGSIHKAMLGGSLRTVAEQFPLPIPESFSGAWEPSVWDDHVMPLARQHVGFLQKYYAQPGMEKFQLAIMMGLASPFMAFVTGEFHSGSSLPRMSALSVSLFSRESARGKTTAAMSALLAYGKPSGLTNDAGKAGTTDNARVSGLSIFGTMPSVMDEMGGASPGSVAGIISAVANGSGKARSTKDGGLNGGVPWALINLVTTNTSQRDMISAVQNDSGAIQYRLLELNVENSPEYDQATRDSFTSDWAKLNRQCTGALGAVIHRELCALGVEKANTLVAGCCAKASAAVKADQSARFQYRGLGALLALHLVLSKLGMSPFPLAPMVEAFKVAHDAGREFVADNVLPTGGLELLSRVLQEMAPHTLVTETETKVNPHTTKYDMPLNARVPDVVYGRHIKTLGRTYLSVNALREWCLKRGVSEPEIIRTARKEGVLAVHTQSQAVKDADRREVRLSAEYYNLAKGLRDSMELRCRVYTLDVRKLFQLLGAEPDDFTGKPKESNVVALHGAAVDATLTGEGKTLDQENAA